MTLTLQEAVDAIHDGRNPSVATPGRNTSVVTASSVTLQIASDIANLQASVNRLTEVVNMLREEIISQKRTLPKNFLTVSLFSTSYSLFRAF